ncbi:helix-turn-helix domain-containing protein [Amycolatopsis suaedae]|uniref:Helix-turn-helix domain-containing protein n=1 Tax=Amycolatopsis suaedae TaxID=2510978 RepID=A0A4Q7JBC0_9PSEU|nr:helix-turn-helix domain-containing protein [Amycolatopsis suaedae]
MSYTEFCDAGSSVFLTIRQTAWLLGVSESRVSWAIRVGLLRAVRRRSRVAIPVADVQRVLAGGDVR